jgi:hypothetical protein
MGISFRFKTEIALAANVRMYNMKCIMYINASILMGQNVSLLRHSDCEKRLGFEMLGLLFRIIQDVKAEIERVSFQLNAENHHEIQIKIHSGNVNFAPNPNLVYGQDTLQNGNPVPPVSIHHY